MSIPTIAVVAALVGLYAAAAVWVWRRDRRRALVRDRIIREAHRRAAAAREIDDLELAYAMPSYDPAWNAGMERLWDAVRDEQNHHQGDNT